MTDITGWDRFWSCYPRKVSRGAALKAWEKLDPDDELITKMILAVDAQKRNRVKVEEHNKSLPEKYKKFIPDWPHPATWLNGQRWDDELTSVMELRAEAKPTNTCPKCSNKEYEHMKNPERLCSWHFSEKWYSDGITGLNVLRQAYKNRTPQQHGETLNTYLKRALRMGADNMKNKKSDRKIMDEESRLEREAIQAETLGTNPERGTIARPHPDDLSIPFE